MTIPAKYKNGVFKPLEEVTLSEGTRVEVYVPGGGPAPHTGHRSLQDLPAYGMWKDRDDMADSVEYIDRLRRNLRGRNTLK